jgi:nucleoside-triphosphatase THEP1
MKINKSQCQPVLVVGSKNSGKTNYLEYLVSRMIDKQVNVAGFLCVVSKSDSLKNNYYLKNVKTSELKLLASKQYQFHNQLQYGDYKFDSRIFELGTRILTENLEADALILDEYGPLEKKGLGFRKPLDFLLENYEGFLFISVRPELRAHLLAALKKLG